jgi:DNA-binding response OmpR family regulator
MNNTGRLNCDMTTNPSEPNNMSEIPPRASILVVDDEELILAVSSEIITLLGYKCYTAEDGDKAIDIVRQQKPDLVLLDFHLPNMPGEKILEKLKFEFPECKVLMASGRELSYEEQHRILNKGACGFLSKPYTIDDLDNTIRSLL